MTKSKSISVLHVYYYILRGQGYFKLIGFILALTALMFQSFFVRRLVLAVYTPALWTFLVYPFIKSDLVQNIKLINPCRRFIQFTR